MTELPSNATKRLKTMAISAGAAVVGVAGADAFDAHAPARHRPADLLPGARTVVVVGGAQPRAGDWVATSPWLLSTMGTTERIQGVGRRLAPSIESELGYDAARCNTRVHTHWVGGFQKVLEETLNEPDREKRKMLVYGDFMTRTLWAITYSSTNIAQCFECMRVCPAAHGLKEMR